MNIKKVCIVGASGKLGQHMVQHALHRGYEVVGVCRERSVGKQSGRDGLRLAGAVSSRRGPRRPGGSVPASVCQQHPVDGRAWERSRGG